jgi:hypothetical protein
MISVLLSVKKIEREERTRYSRVNPISRIDFDPAQTTTTGVSLSEMRSLEISKPAAH